MKGKVSTKAVLITVLTVVLLGTAATGTVLFLKDSGEASATEEQNPTATLPNAGEGENGDVTIPPENAGDDNEDTTGTTPTGTTGVTTPTQATRTITAVPDASTIEVENDSVTRTLGWNNLIVSNDNKSFNNSINYSYLTLKINYLFEDENIAAEAYEAQVLRGEEYSVESPIITGYVADMPVVEGKTQATYIEYTVIYTAETYNISIDLNGGTLPEGKENPTTYTIEDEDIVLNNPEKEGYTFDGWQDGEGNDLGTEVTIENGNTGDKEYIATWVANDYTLTLDGNGGTLAKTNYFWWFSYITYEPTITKTVTFDSQYGELQTPIRLGYTFAGWNTKQDGTGDTITSDTIVKTADDHTIYAQWTPIVYTITYKNIDGLTLENPTTYTVETETFTLNNPEKEGYTFDGWVRKGGFNAHNPVTITKGSTGDREYTAKWHATNYTLTLDGNGGTLAKTNYIWWFSYITYEPTITKTVTFDSPYGELQTPIRPGYTFTEWNTKQDGTGDTITSDTIVKTAGNHTIYAQWEPITYKISYNLNGGYILWGFNPETYTIESSDINLVNPYKFGYTFAGWTGTDLTEPTTDVTITTGSIGDREYTANWTPDSYQIMYFGIEGAEVENPNSYTIETPTFTLNKPTKTGYTFTGWTGSNGFWRQENVTIYTGSFGFRFYIANWRVNSYTLTFDSNGGSAVEPITQDYGTTITAPANPTREGYTFAGWSEEIPETMPAKNMTIKATWNENTNTLYKVEHYKEQENGTFILAETENLSGTTGSNVTATEKQYSGYTFDSENSDLLKSGEIKPDGSLTLRMYYKITRYKVTFKCNVLGAKIKINDNETQLPITKEVKYGESLSYIVSADYYKTKTGSVNNIQEDKIITIELERNNYVESDWITLVSNYNSNLKFQPSATVPQYHTFPSPFDSGNSYNTINNRIKEEITKGKISKISIKGTFWRTIDNEVKVSYIIGGQETEIGAYNDYGNMSFSKDIIFETPITIDSYTAMNVMDNNTPYNPYFQIKFDYSKPVNIIHINSLQIKITYIPVN